MSHVLLSAFGDLEERLLASWAELRDSESHLVPAAVAAVESMRGDSRLDPVACLQWFLAKDTVPKQEWDFDFGQPAITIIHNDAFRADLLYWVENATPIHDHVTCGAFMALKGARLHGLYEFTPSDDLGPHMALGDLRRTRLELMKEGDVREIRPDLIHDLYWLGKPSVTLVIRCAGHPAESTTQPREYWPPGIGYVNRRHQQDARLHRQVEALQLLRQAAPSQYEAAVSSVLQPSLDPCLRYYAFLDAALAASQVLDRVMDRHVDDAGDPLLSALRRARPSMRRRSLYAGVHVPNEAAQLVAGLLWAGASPADAGRILSQYRPSYTPEVTLGEARSSLGALSENLARDVMQLAERVA